MMGGVATDPSSTSSSSSSSSKSDEKPPRRARRTRMTGAERRQQLLDIGRGLFAEKGFEATSVEEIASKAGVSKPVVYEHFGGKEGLYAVVVDREMQRLLDMVTSSLTAGHPRELCEQAAFALLDYIEEYTDGFRILVRDSPVAQSTGTFASLISDIATKVEDILGLEFKARGFDPKLAPLYAQALVGSVALTGQWWVNTRKPKKAEVAAHLVNLAWHGLGNLEAKPRLIGHRKN
ncbi:TetR/AcrR family transcriptional regulator [Streptomyces sp. YIM 130001]|uniref:TetR/AcrR family transcriptional regulator n=1 Tax=Streptomyces sp. YIM 130001 TaxID=2259644 RepID=UPI000E65728E|nr:TetR/AcrR family transcriptional regulator [Streptomyces sp. YIM 130001]